MPAIVPSVRDEQTRVSRVSKSSLNEVRWHLPARPLRLQAGERERCDESKTGKGVCSDRLSLSLPFAGRE